MSPSYITEHDLTANYKAVQERISRACRRSGRLPSEVTTVVVTKTHPVEVVRKACALGICHLGENRVQEAIEKYGNSHIHDEFSGTHLHLIGNLQRNKVRKALQIFDSVDSVDSADLAHMLDLEAGRAGRGLRVLLEVNTSNEPQKHGVEPDSTMHLASEVLACQNLRLTGLMTVGPNVEDENRIRGSFRLLKQLFDEVAERLKPDHWSVLSMGMSGDYEIAIEEGATELRLGTAIFGQRRG